MLQDGLTSKPSKGEWVHTGGEGEDAIENRLRKVARHFSQLIDGKLPGSLRCSGDVFFWLRDWISKLKTRQIKKYSVLAEIPKFNAPPNFPAIRYFKVGLLGVQWNLP